MTPLAAVVRRPVEQRVAVLAPVAEKEHRVETLSGRVPRGVMANDERSNRVIDHAWRDRLAAGDEHHQSSEQPETPHLRVQRRQVGAGTGRSFFRQKAQGFSPALARMPVEKLGGMSARLQKLMQHFVANDGALLKAELRQVDLVRAPSTQCSGVSAIRCRVVRDVPVVRVHEPTHSCEVTAKSRALFDALPIVAIERRGRERLMAARRDLHSSRTRGDAQYEESPRHGVMHDLKYRHVGPVRYPRPYHIGARSMARHSVSA